MDARAAAACEWGISQLEGSHWSVEAIGSDASSRRYFRLRGSNQTFIVMDAPPNSPEISPFIDVQQRLSSASLHVPTILACEPGEGWMLLTDLGQQTFLEALQDAPSFALLDKALSALETMQTQVATQGLEVYDAAKLQREMDLFVDWFLAQHWSVTPTAAELDRWHALCAELIDVATSQTQVFCHRDFMPRNLMVSQPNPGIIDFQDACIGPVTYDLVSLYLDAFISWPRDQVDEAFERHRHRLLTQGVSVPDSANEWLMWCDAMSVQRHLKVIGIFARIAYRDHKPHYLADTPRFFDYLSDTLGRLPRLSPLAELIHAWRQRATPERA